MPNEDDVKACAQGPATSGSHQRQIASWVRIPEAWQAWRDLPPEDAQRFHTPFDLAAWITELQTGTTAPSVPWQAVASLDKQAPSDFAEVMRLADALRLAVDASPLADIARLVCAKPTLWRSPLALAWATLPHAAEFAGHLISVGESSGASLLANALLAAASPCDAAAALGKQLGPDASRVLSCFVQAGETRLAGLLASAMPEGKAPVHNPGAVLEAALRAQAQGDLTLARQMLIDGWDHLTEMGAAFGDRLADVAIAQADPVSACEALKRALLLQPSRERRARLAALLAEMGRIAEATEWLSESPQDITEHIAAAVVMLGSGDHQQAAAHLQQAVDGLDPDDALAAPWLERLVSASQKLEQSQLAIRSLEQLAQLRPEDPGLRASLTKHLLASNAPEAAVRHARALSDLQPDSDDAHRLLARALQATGKTEQALGLWDSLAQPTSHDQLEAGECALAAHNSDEAIRVARKVLLSNPGSPGALTLLGRAHVAAGKPEEALAHLRAACEADPHQPAAWTAIADCQAACGDLQAAGNTLAAAVQAAPGDVGLWHAYAAWLRKQGRTSEALDAAARSISAADAPLEWRLDYGQLLTAMGHPEQAVEMLRADLAKHPTSWSTRRSLAEALLLSGQTAEAASVVAPIAQDAEAAELAFAGRVLATQASAAGDSAIARRALALLDRGAAESPAPESDLWAAKALEACGELDHAFDRYHAALEAAGALNPDDHRQASLGLARCATALRRAPAAIHALESAVEAYGASSELDLALSIAFAAAGQHRRALEAAERAAQSAPDEASLRQLTQAAAQAGDTATAIEAIHKLVSLEPSNPHVWFGLAELAAQSSDLGQARHALAMGMRHAGQDPTAWARASELLLRNSRPTSAQRALRRALACSPRDPALVRQMAEVSQHAGDSLTAQRAWIRYGELRADDAVSLKLAARSLSMLGQRAMAIGLWQRAVALDPKDTDAQSDLARAYLTEGDAARALALYRSATSAETENTALALEAAAAELHYGSPDAAVELFRSATLRAPQEPSAWQGLGEGLLMLRRPHEARPALETAYRLDPTRVQTMAALSIASLDTGDAPMAAAIYQSAQRHACENAPAAALLARAAVALLQWDEALTALDHFNATSPSLASIRAGIEIRLRMADADWIFRAAGALAHAPSSRWSIATAGEDVHALLGKLAGAAPSWEAERLRQRGRVTFGDADPFALVEAARSDPSGEASEGIAVALLRKGRAEEALAIIHPGNQTQAGRWEHLLAGLAFTAAGQMQQAREALHEAASDAALRPLAAYLSARTALIEGDAEAFAEHASTALVEWSDEPTWHFELANAYLKMGRPDTALPHLHQAAELAPQASDYTLAFARTAQQAGDLASAQSAYARATECAPTCGEVWKEAALCALSNDDAATAGGWFETARRLLPGDLDTLLGSARTSLATGNVREAHQHAQAAYHLAPDDSEVLQVLGLVFARQGKLDRALQSFDQALRRAGDRLPVHIGRSRLLVQIGRGEQAVSALKSAIAESPDSDAGWAALAEIEEASGSLPQAIDAAERAVQLAPRSPAHRLLLGRLCRKSGHLDRALDELLRAQAGTFAGSGLSFEIGRVYEERREFKRSLDAYQHAIDADPSHGEAHYRAGLVLKQIKAYPQAGKMLKRAVELNPKDPEALHQLAAVRALELVHGGIAQQVVAP